MKDIKAHNFPLSVSAQDLSEETVRNMFSHVVQEWKEAHNQNMYFEEEFKKEKSAYWTLNTKYEKLKTQYAKKIDEAKE